MHTSEGDAIGVAEVAALLGVTPGRVHQLDHELEPEVLHHGRKPVKIYSRRVVAACLARRAELARVRASRDSSTRAISGLATPGRSRP